MPDRLPSLVVLVGFWIPPAVAGWAAAVSLQRSTKRARATVTYAVLATFVRAHPQVRLEITIDDRNVDIVEDKDTLQSGQVGCEELLHSSQILAHGGRQEVAEFGPIHRSQELTETERQVRAGVPSPHSPPRRDPRCCGAKRSHN